MPGKSAAAADMTADLFAALGDKTRLQLVRRLCDAGPASITQLSSGLDLSRQAVTKHLRVMENCGLVSSAKQGREQIFELQQKRFEIAQSYLQLVSRQWDQAIERLKRHVEDTD